MKNEETIFSEAAAIECRDARAAYLEQACGGDAAVRREVDGLLAAHERAAGFMDSPAPVALATDAATSRPTGGAALEAVGATVGPYRLLERIGEGGMGVVYKAKQVSIDRVIAIKVLNPQMASDQQWVQRFANEARACSRLQHPNTIRMFDFGQSQQDGRYFLTMEFLDGQVLRAAITQGPMPPNRVA